MNVLFITANRVGDAVLSTGVLAHLVERYPAARFTIACGPYAAGLFRAVPRLERIIVLEKKSWNRHWLGLWAACAGLRWDVVVDLRDSAVSRLLHAKKRYVRRARPGQHKVIENATTLGLDPPPAPHIWLDAEASKQAAVLLPAARALLAFGPAANWPPKQWPVERFAALAQKLTATGGLLAGAAVVIIADTHERAQLAPLLRAIPDAERVELFGRGLLTAAAAIKQCKLFVGNDSGLMHLAAAVGTPTLGLFGPGYEEIYGPWGAHCAFVRTTERREELLARLPNMDAREPNLMLGLSVEKAYEATKRLMEQTMR